MLTRSQAKVAELVARGLSSKRIAREIGISPETVNAHISAAAARIPGDGRPRFKLTVWAWNLSDDE